jgi:hypothetical protein
MNVLNDPQQLACLFNADEAVWRRYLQRRGRRRSCGLPSLLPEEVLDRLDWLDAERECREIRCVGRPIS